MSRSSDLNNGFVVTDKTWFGVSLGDTLYGSLWKIDSNVTGEIVTIGTTVISFQSYSFPTFPLSVSNGDALYIGSSQPKQFSGIKIDLTASLTLSSGTSTDAIVWEYWDGGSWVTLNIMSTLSKDPYTSNANETFAFGDVITTILSYQYRFANISSTWSTTVVNGTLGYWIRARVANAAIVTQVPVVGMIKLHSNRTEINADGFVEYFGFRQPVKYHQVHLETTEPTGVTTDPSNQRIVASNTPNVVSANIGDNEYPNGSLRARTYVFILPNDLDTSKNVIFRIGMVKSGGNNSNTTIFARYANVRDGYILGVPGGSTTSVGFSNTQSVPIPATNRESFSRDLTLDFSEYVPGDTVWITFGRDGVSDLYNGTILFHYVCIQYVKWSEGA